MGYSLSKKLNIIKILLKQPIIPSIYSFLFQRINTKKLFTLLDPIYIQKHRFFYYWNAAKITSAIKMESVPWTYETILDYLWKLNIKSHDYKILDFWCGQHQSKYLRSLYWNNVFSTDIIDFKISNFIKIDPRSTTLSFNDEKFNIVICSEVLEHVRFPFVLLDELIRVAGDYVIFSTPNPMILISRKKFYKTGFLHWFSLSDHDYHKTPIFYRQIEDYLKDKNLKFERFANHSFFWLKWDDIKYGESLIYIIHKK